jgi:hypothetical protein
MHQLRYDKPTSRAHLPDAHHGGTRKDLIGVQPHRHSLTQPPAYKATVEQTDEEDK